MGKKIIQFPCIPNSVQDDSGNNEFAAQQLIYDAWESDEKEARKLAKKALKLWPDCADAYNVLGDCSGPKAAMKYYQQAVDAGKRALSSAPFKKDVGSFWGILETRPYMRALANKSRLLLSYGDKNEAIDIMHEMLRLNGNDNQGVRHILLSNLIQMRKLDEAEDLYNKYKEDVMLGWIYSRVLLDFYKGDHKNAVTSLKRAVKANKHVAKYLLDRKLLPRYHPDYYSIGDEDEAVIYVFGNSLAWSEDALAWLKENR